MKCTFYEVTGNTNCPFHVIKFTPYWDLNTASDYIAFKRLKRVKKLKTTRRTHGKSR
jgi:hypothetical protein